jgi:very-short-patch-repair endonuclease
MRGEANMGRYMSEIEDMFERQLVEHGVADWRPWEREFKFHPTRKWRSDFAWKEDMLLVEIEGGIYAGGRHTRGKGFENDCEKYNVATLMGYSLLRFSGGMVENGVAAKMVGMFLAGRGLRDDD